MSIKPDQNQKRVSIRQTIRPSNKEGEDQNHHKKYVKLTLFSTVKNKLIKKSKIQVLPKILPKEALRHQAVSRKKERIERFKREKKRDSYAALQK